MSSSLDILSSPSKRLKHHRSKAKQIIKQLNLLAFKTGTQYAVVLVEPDGQTDIQVSDAFRSEIHRWVQDKDLSHMRKLSRESYYRKIQEKRCRTLHSSEQHYSVRPNERLSKDYRFPLQELDPNQTKRAGYCSLESFSQTINHNENSIEALNLIENTFDPPSGRFSVRYPKEPVVSDETNDPVNPCDDNVSDYLKRKYSKRDRTSAWRSSNSTITLHSSPELATNSENQHTQQQQGPPLVLSQNQSLAGKKGHQIGTISLLHRPLPKSNFPRESEWVSDSADNFLPVSLGDTDKILKIVSLAFDLLQQGICKIVCKVWIKVIEPKKQTNFPYNKGEDSKPDWWPLFCRHREPDHLVKSERIAVLWSILFSSRVSAAQLRIATAECANKLSSSKCAILEELFYMSDMYRRMIQGDILNSTAIWILKDIVSTDNSNGLVDKLADEVKSKLGPKTLNLTDHSRELHDYENMASTESFSVLHDHKTTDKHFMPRQLKRSRVCEPGKEAFSLWGDDSTFHRKSINVENNASYHNRASLLCEHDNQSVGLNLFIDNMLPHENLENIQESEKMESMLGYDPDLFLQDIDMHQH